VETLVAITILMVVIVGPLYAVHKALIASYAARDKLIAAALAQEGVEYVLSIRDDNYLSRSGSWLAGLDGTSNGNNSANCFSNACIVDQSQNLVQACGSNGCAPLRLSPANIYTQTVNAAYPVTKFTRQVGVANVSEDQITVTVTVSWSTLGVPYTTSVTEQLYNWL
jgi:hypothetical protein